MPDSQTEQESPPTTWNRAYGEQLDSVGMERIDAYSVRIDEAIEKLRGVYVAVVDDRSSLRLDDRYLGAWRGGGLAVGALAASVDALETLRVVVLDAGVIPMTALYPLLRGALENASSAIYLLSPPSRDQRLQRAYWFAFEDARLRRTYEEERGSTAANSKLDEIEDDLRQLVSLRPALGDPASFGFPRVHYSAIVAGASKVLAEDPAVSIESEINLLAVWQLLSGLSHGRQWAMIEVLERSGAVVYAADASAQVRMTTSPAVVAWFLDRSLQALEGGLRLFGRRSKAAWAEPEDANEPQKGR